MRFALDKEGKRTFIEEASYKEEYFCPICHALMIQRKGMIYAHHFAHSKLHACSDLWHYEEKSLWHSSWQDRFEKEKQEVIMKKDDKTHIADVYLPEYKTVIEFQHSPLSKEEFNDRNSFYTSLGNRVIWVFDMREEFLDSRIQTIHGSKDKFHYLNPRRVFSDYDAKNKGVLLFFQSEGTDDGKDILLNQINWISPKGIYYFCAKRRTIDEFVMVVEKKAIPLIIEKHSVIYYWNKEKTKAMILINQKTDDEYLFTVNPMEQLEKYNAIYARKENSFGEFKKESERVYDFNEPIWRAVWYKKDGDDSTKKHK